MGEFTSYWLYQKYVSTDSGQTYVPVSPAVYSINGDGTMPLSAKSEYDEACGYVPPTPTAIYRWVDMDISTDYICDECPDEYVYKLIASYSNGDEYEIECDGNSTLSSSETTAYTEPKSACTSVVIGECVTTIGQGAFYLFSNMASITLPSGLTTVGDTSISNCYSLTTVNVPASVTTIEDYAFNSSYNLQSITINATTPPTLGQSVFTHTNDCPIYVPAASVNTYKNASGWSTYASRIQAIS